MKRVKRKNKVSSLQQNAKMSQSKRTRCEVYSRVVGYIRPVSNWNKGKKAEWEMRKEFVA